MSALTFTSSKDKHSDSLVPRPDSLLLGTFALCCEIEQRHHRYHDRLHPCRVSRECVRVSVLFIQSVLEQRPSELERPLHQSPSSTVPHIYSIHSWRVEPLLIDFRTTQPHSLPLLVLLFLSFSLFFLAIKNKTGKKYVPCWIIHRVTFVLRHRQSKSNPFFFVVVLPFVCCFFFRSK